MGIIHRLSRKCVFCKIAENTEWVEDYGIYAGVFDGDWFHKDCLRKVVCKPEKYSHNIVDRALHIIERIEIRKRANERRKKILKEKCETIEETLCPKCHDDDLKPL